MPEQKLKNRVLIIGNFLSQAGFTQTFPEELLQKISLSSWLVYTASGKPQRMLRLVDMVYTTWYKRKEYGTAFIAVYSGMAFLWAELVASLLQRLRKPFVMALHGGNLPEFARRHPKRVKTALQKANLVIAPSGYLQEQMRAYRADIRVIPNPVDISRYPYRTRSRPAARLVWLRSFHQIYHPELAVQVIHILREKYPDVHLNMIGPDKGDGSLQRAMQLARELGVQKYISFPGGITKSKVPTELSQHDIFLNTTNIDNTPISVLEAMACGLCVVSTNVGGIPYLLEDGVDALLVPVDDSQAMAEAIRRILTQPGLAASLSANARVKAEQHDWAIVLPQWEELFTSLISHA